MSGEDGDDRTKPVQLLPVATEPRGGRPGLSRYVLPASFITQLIAEREHFEVQRVHRRSPASTALGAYSAGARSTERRMPAGYRHTRDV